MSYPVIIGLIFVGFIIGFLNTVLFITLYEDAQRYGKLFCPCCGERTLIRK